MSPCRPPCNHTVVIVRLGFLLFKNVKITVVHPNDFFSDKKLRGGEWDGFGFIT